MWCHSMSLQFAMFSRRIFVLCFFFSLEKPESVKANIWNQVIYWGEVILWQLAPCSVTDATVRPARQDNSTIPLICHLIALSVSWSPVTEPAQYALDVQECRDACFIVENIKSVELNTCVQKGKGKISLFLLPKCSGMCTHMPSRASQYKLYRPTAAIKHVF